MVAHVSNPVRGNAIAHKGEWRCVWCEQPIFGRALFNGLNSNVARTKHLPVVHIECAFNLGVQAGHAAGQVAQIVDFTREATWDSSRESE